MNEERLKQSIMRALFKNERYLKSHQAREEGQLLASVLAVGGGWLHRADSSELVEIWQRT